MWSVDGEVVLFIFASISGAWPQGLLQRLIETVVLIRKQGEMHV